MIATTSPNILVMTETTTTAGTTYYTDFSVVYWFLGIEIVLLILILFKKRK